MRCVDLSLPLKPGMRGVEFEQACTVKAEGWNARNWTLYSHCGTHMDAPWHFEAGDQRIDQIPLERCQGPAWIADVTAVEPKGLIDVADLGSAAEKLQPGDNLLLRSLWSRYADDADYYRNSFPRISEPLAKWCVERKVNLLGVEPPSVADVNNIEEVTRVHQILLGGGVIIVEGLTGLDQLKADRVTFMAFPLKLHEGDGSPVRALAIESEI